MKKRQPEENTFGWRLMRAREEERNSLREQRLDDITEHTLRYLEMADVRTANAWLRLRFQVTVERKRVTDIQILF